MLSYSVQCVFNRWHMRITMYASIAVRDLVITCALPSMSLLKITSVHGSAHLYMPRRQCTASRGATTPTVYQELQYHVKCCISNLFPFERPSV